jgi:hypothetical protein
MLQDIPKSFGKYRPRSHSWQTGLESNSQSRFLEAKTTTSNLEEGLFLGEE